MKLAIKTTTLLNNNCRLFVEVMNLTHSTPQQMKGNHTAKGHPSIPKALVLSHF
jgi:hypothetical protein